MAYLDTTADDPPVFMERISTPYAYTKPSKESILPSASDYVLSPEPMTPRTSDMPRSFPQRNNFDGQRDQNARPPSRSQREHPKNYVFDDDDIEVEDVTHLRTERKPARYSFVKDDFQKEDLRTNLRDLKIDDHSNHLRQVQPQDSSRSKHDSAVNGSSGSSKRSSPPPRSPRDRKSVV